jgi:hypothetical protein
VIPGIPGHTSPPYSEAAKDNALFHYTTARGLIGILSAGRIWSTAYHCANDESELAAGRGALTPLFRKFTHKLIESDDPRVMTFGARGVDVMSYADGFESQMISTALSLTNTFITCFCKASTKEDFTHGLLSQWRGYGVDGGYALQFNRQKLENAVKPLASVYGYDLHDVHYSATNPLRAEMLAHADAYVNAYSSFIDELAKPLDFSAKTTRSPIAGLAGGPIEDLLNYLIHTKNQHFGEERECRLSVLQASTSISGSLPIWYFDRAGLVVPYIQSPTPEFNVLDCIDWIVVGPGPRMASRFKSAAQLAHQYCKNVYVRPSHIPYTRF